MDVSMAAYICVIPFITSFFWGKKSYLSFIKFYSIFAIILSAGIVVFDLELYNAWKYRLEYPALEYLKNINEATASMASSPIGLLMTIYISVVLFFYYIHSKMFLAPAHTLAIKKTSVGWALITTALLFLPMRGGLGIAPLNPGAIYFSNQLFANHSALNGVWNFMHSAFNYNVKTNPFITMDDTEAKNIVEGMLREPASIQDSWLKIKKPNVLIVIWESFTAKVVDKKYKGIEVTPFFNQLKNKGIYFSNAYASGDRTAKGIAAVLSGYPAQPTTSIVKEAQKAASLPILSKSFNAKSYHTSFYYGGDLEFANMKAYLYNGEFEKLISKSDFDAAQSNTKWGAHDHFLFNKYLIDKQKETKTPFFDVIMTLSSHEPFETPTNTVIPGDDDESKFLNSLHYTDQSLGDFINKASTLDWWDNTVVIIVADHGHRLPVAKSRIDDFHIPILWTGGAIDTNFIVNNYTSQIDIGKTLLNQLSMPSESYVWSKSFNPDNSWAYFSFNNGFGYVDDDCKIVFDNPSKKPVEVYGICNKGQRKGHAYLQRSFDHYLSAGKK
jgi:phosphoglycerol transferase MdoB-like AlkP superfamily enzyme